MEEIPLYYHRSRKKEDCFKKTPKGSVVITKEQIELQLANKEKGKLKRWLVTRREGTWWHDRDLETGWVWLSLGGREGEGGGGTEHKKSYSRMGNLSQTLYPNRQKWQEKSEKKVKNLSTDYNNKRNYTNYIQTSSQS